MAHIRHKHPLFLGEAILVRTNIASIAKRYVVVNFEIIRRKNRKRAADGYCQYALVNRKTGRGQMIPDDIFAAYAI